jgi:hypothetical protein
MVAKPIIMIVLMVAYYREVQRIVTVIMQVQIVLPEPLVVTAIPDGTAVLVKVRQEAWIQRLALTAVFWVAAMHCALVLAIERRQGITAAEQVATIVQQIARRQMAGKPSTIPVLTVALFRAVRRIALA